jgi:membrane protein YqaA with SNARE-associated domain
MRRSARARRKFIIAAVFVTFVAAVIILSILLAVMILNIPEDLWRSIGYPSAFLLGLVGSASIIIPVPTTFVLLGMALARFFHPVILGLAFGVGAAIGQLTSYVVGYVGGLVVSPKQERRMRALSEIFDRYGVLAVFLFALTPLPDSLLFIPMGLVHYSIWKLFAAAVAGKILMSLIITHFGEVMGQAFEESWVFTAVTAFLLVLVVVAMFRVDWEKIAERYLPKNKKVRAI